MAIALVLLGALTAPAAPAHADRSRLFPTLGVGMAWTSGDEDINALIWAGVLSRPTRGSGAFWGATLEADIGDGVASFMPTARAGGIVFEDDDSPLHIASGYLIAGAGLRTLHDEPEPVVRAGIGLQLLPLVLIAGNGFICPDVFEVVTDVGASDAVTTLRVSWGL